MPKHSALALCLALLASGCSLMPDYLRPQAPVKAEWPVEKSSAGEARQALTTEWRAFFPDSRLQALIGAALEHNQDMKIALARIEEARALYGIARADRLPNLDINVSGASAKTPADLSTAGREIITRRYDANVTLLSFELDLWGRVRSLNAAALANYLATEEAQRAFRLSLIADVANAYLTLLELDERVTLARETMRTRAETRTMIDRRREVGLASDVEYLAAEGIFQQARTDLANLERQRSAADNALTLLVGKPPVELPAGRGLSEQGIVPDLIAGVPAEVLLKRPDVLAAEQKLIAANANIGAARAAFLPRIALTGSAGDASSALSRLFDSGSGAWAFQPVLRLPLFDFGRNSANLDVASARKVIAVAEYEKAIQQAFREVSDLLSARTSLAAQLQAQQEVEKTQNGRLKLAKARFEAGIANYLEVLDAERDAFNAQQATLQVRRAWLSTAAQLYKALGGGAT